MPGADEVSRAVLDASVAVKWLISERGSEAAAALLERSIAWIAPRLMVTEVASALRRKIDGAEIRAEHAAEALATLLQAFDDGIVELAEDEAIVSAAMSLALSLGHKVPDCLYLALAQREGAALATADAKLRRLAESQGTVVLAPA